MRAAVLLALGLVLVSGLGGCADEGEGDGEAEPLTLEQRVLTDADAPDSEPDPVETRVTAASFAELEQLEDLHIPAAAASELKEAGFVSALQETRFYPESAGGPHTREAPHVRVLVVQFASEEGAAAGAELLHQQTLKPCPGVCSAQIEEFDVDGVPDAYGTSTVVTQERLDQLNEDGEPSDAYTITFADGEFVYQVEGFGPPGAMTEEEVEDLAQRLHDRVEGAPPA